MSNDGKAKKSYTINQGETEQIKKEMNINGLCTLARTIEFQ